jgi:hypothetical protein
VVIIKNMSQIKIVINLCTKCFGVLKPNYNKQ